jgi:DNA-binding NarL/FixJ family response regulator
MKARSSRHLQIDVAIADDDPLRMIGFRALLEQEHADLDVAPIRLMEMKASLHASVVLLRDRAGHNLADEIDKLKAALPGTRILVTGPSPDENAILESLSLGARGYLSETASSADFVKAIRIVHQGLIWAPRLALATFIGRAAGSLLDARYKRAILTDRQKEVLQMLVAGRSNKEIAAPLGIEERTVKAHVAQLMRKLGARNRISLSVHAVTHSIVAV